MTEQVHISSPAHSPIAAAESPAAIGSELMYDVIQQPVVMQCKLSIGAVDDPFETEADAMADKVMRMSIPGEPARSSMPAIQRKCAACEEEEEQVQRKPLAASVTPFIQTKGGNGGTASNTVSRQVNATRGQGTGMDVHTRSFMESRFGTDFSGVRIHTGDYAIQMSREVNAQAFTVGNDIYFNNGKYNPSSDSGRHLLAHELTHTIQQGGHAQQVQRTMHNGHDNYASYTFNDSACTLQYSQHWYFDFSGVTLVDAEKTRLMQAAATQVHDQWSNKFPLMPATGGAACPCSSGGVAVDVSINPTEGEKTGRGIGVTVRPSVRAFVNPVSGSAELEHNASTSDFRGTTYPRTGLQYTVAHEFGHTIDITDEYNGWMGFFAPRINEDENAMMNSGNEVRTRHYQYFGDLISREILGCRYNPNGVREPEFENPVFRTSSLAGLTTAQDGLRFPGVSTDGAFGANFDFRLSNERLMGIFYPQAGAIRFLDPASGGGDSIGATAGVRLGHIAYPLVVNLRTGIAVNPMNPGASVSVPISLQAGLRTSAFEFGFHYTPVVNVLAPSQVTHLFGAGITF